MKNKHAEYSFEEFFLYFNRLNKFTSSCELHPIKGFFPTSILEIKYHTLTLGSTRKFLPLYVYQHIGLLIEEMVG